MTATQKRQLQEPTSSATPHERRKFGVLVVLGFVVVILLWIWTLPLNFRNTTGGPAGPRQFFSVLSDQVGATLRSYQQAKNDASTSNNNSPTTQGTNSPIE